MGHWKRFIPPFINNHKNNKQENWKNQDQHTGHGLIKVHSRGVGSTEYTGPGPVVQEAYDSWSSLKHIHATVFRHFWDWESERTFHLKKFFLQFLQSPLFANWLILNDGFNLNIYRRTLFQRTILYSFIQFYILYKWKNQFFSHFLITIAYDDSP